MTLLIPKLVLCPSKPRAEAKDVFCYFSSFAIAAEGGEHRGEFLPGRKKLPDHLFPFSAE
jgi:hypothetical protein